MGLPKRPVVRRRRRRSPFSAATTAEHVKESVQPFDWTYSTDYAGTLTASVNGKVPLRSRSAAGCARLTRRSQRPRRAAVAQIPMPTELGIDYELLKRPDPILFYDELTLYEDELADNGAAQLTVRLVRVRWPCTLSRAVTRSLPRVSLEGRGPRACVGSAACRRRFLCCCASCCAWTAWSTASLTRACGTSSEPT